MKRAGHDEGVEDVRFLIPGAVKVWAYGLIDPYLAGELFYIRLFYCLIVKPDSFVAFF